MQSLNPYHSVIAGAVALAFALAHPSPAAEPGSPPSDDYMPGWVVPHGYRAPNAVVNAPTRPAPAPSRLPVRPPAPTDRTVRRTQTPGPTPDLPAAALPTAVPGGANLAADLNVSEGSGQSISLQAALYGALTSNPDLVTLRNSNVASPESVEVARRFPTTLNPTVWVDYRPITLIPRDPTAPRDGPYYQHGKGFFYISLRQPVELGHQTTHRHAIASAALLQQQWTVVQAELLALVQTYRFFQTAAYRREKLRLAGELADFNDRLLDSLKKRLDANQVGAADVVLGEVENRATRQQSEVANQDYANALADLRNQLGRPETGAFVEPLGEFALPGVVPQLEEAALVRQAVQCRPDIHAARAQAAGAEAAVRLARGDRIPTPVVGPVFQSNEAGAQFVGLVYISAIPVWNSGRPLVSQREADHRRALASLQQAEQRAATQVRAAVSKWNAAERLVSRTAGISGLLRTEVAKMERLFEENQADLTKLLQARQRLLQLQNAELDATWQATQAQADLLTALGAPGLITALAPTTEPGR